MRQTAQLRGARGLTLIEIIVSTAILTIGLTGLAAAMLGAVAGSEYSRSESVALQDAKQVLERLSNIPAVGSAASNGTLLNEAQDINAGNWNLTPWGAGAQPLGLPNETVTVYVNQNVLGAPMQINVNALPAVANVGAVPTANRDPLELIVVVNWTQGMRPSGVVMRSVINVPS